MTLLLVRLPALPKHAAVRLARRACSLPPSLPPPRPGLEAKLGVGYCVCLEPKAGVASAPSSSPRCFAQAGKVRWRPRFIIGACRIISSVSVQRKGAGGSLGVAGETQGKDPGKAALISPIPACPGVPFQPAGSRCEEEHAVHPPAGVASVEPPEAGLREARPGGC